MPLNFFYIINDPGVALIAEKHGVDRIWIDLEQLGKEERQPGMKTVKSRHTIEDISAMKPLLTKSEILVRVNPWNPGSKQEIDAVVQAGADIIMLPYWKTIDEVERFLNAVNGRCRTTLLLETKEAVECIDEVLKLDFDEIHIGLNDLQISYHLKFMFEFLTNGIVEQLCGKFAEKGIPYGFGGIARIGQGLLPSEKVIMEHYRLGSTRAILSRSFCNIENYTDENHHIDYEAVEKLFAENMKKTREYEAYCSNADDAEKERNRIEVVNKIKEIVRGIEKEEQ